MCVLQSEREFSLVIFWFGILIMCGFHVSAILLFKPDSKRGQHTGIDTPDYLFLLDYFSYSTSTKDKRVVSIFTSNSGLEG